MNEVVEFGSQKIKFKLVFSARKTLGITVTPDIEVIVKAPDNTSLERIKEKVKKRAPWILKQKSYFLAYLPKTPPKKFVGGESHLYLGRQYLLKVKTGSKESVQYKGRVIEVTAKEKSKVKVLMTRWYRERAKEKYVEIAEPLIVRFKKYGVEPSGIYIQDMSGRWGSCTPKGKIILNTELINAPRRCIEYVIIHELCHLVHYNHNQRFLDLQNYEMPDWEKWKVRLERLMA